MSMRILLPLLAFLALGTTIMAGGPDEAQELRESALDTRITDAQDEYELAAGLKVLIDQATDEDLSRLVAHDNTTVALAAAWERVRRTMPDDVPGRSVDVDKAALSRFLGFVEGRLRVPVPAFWQTAVSGAQTEGGKKVRFPSQRPPEAASHRDSEQPAPHIRAVSEGVVAVSVGKEEWRIPVDYNVSAGYLMSLDVVVTLTDEMAYLITADDDIVGDVYAVRRKDGTLAWRSRVWVHARVGGSSVPPTYRGSLVACGNTLLIFGADFGSVHIEAFDAKSGEPLCRFSTSYLEYKP